MHWFTVIIIYMLLFAFTTFIAHKKGGVWAKNEGEGIGTDMFCHGLDI